MLSRNGFQEIACASSSSVCQGNRLPLRRLSVLILAEVFWIGKLMDGHLEPYVVRDGIKAAIKRSSDDAFQLCQFNGLVERQLKLDKLEA